MWRPPFEAPSASSRNGGVLLVLVRFEPVRSALPPMSSGSVFVKASRASWLALREATVSAYRPGKVAPSKPGARSAHA